MLAISDRAKRSIRRMGDTQRSILLWLAFHSPALHARYRELGFEVAGELASTKPRSEQFLADFRKRVEMQQAAEVLAGAKIVEEGTVRAADEGRPEIRWSVVGNRSPTRAESATRSHALKRLEERGLVTRLSSSPQTRGPQRTDRVRITPTGIEATLYWIYREQIDAASSDS